jgi:1,2-dihydroxy-3-keto-5-methylthiopentene dioxygenase
MAIVTVPDKNVVLRAAGEISAYLAGVNIGYERWDNVKNVPVDASDEEILNAYSVEIERLKAEGGYAAADVINIVPSTPGLDAMLGKFSREH